MFDTDNTLRTFSTIKLTKVHDISSPNSDIPILKLPPPIISPLIDDECNYELLVQNESTKIQVLLDNISAVVQMQALCSESEAPKAVIQQTSFAFVDCEDSFASAMGFESREAFLLQTIPPTMKNVLTDKSKVLFLGYVQLTHIATHSHRNSLTSQLTHIVTLRVHFPTSSTHNRDIGLIDSTPFIKQLTFMTHPKGIMQPPSHIAASSHIATFRPQNVHCNCKNLLPRTSLLA